MRARDGAATSLALENLNYRQGKPFPHGVNNTPHTQVTTICVRSSTYETGIAGFVVDGRGRVVAPPLGGGDALTGTALGRGAHVLRGPADRSAGHTNSHKNDRDNKDDAEIIKTTQPSNCRECRVCMYGNVCASVNCRTYDSLLRELSPFRPLFVGTSKVGRKALLFFFYMRRFGAFLIDALQQAVLFLQLCLPPQIHDT